MASETMYGTHGFLDIIRKGRHLLTPDNFETCILSVGGDTAKAGMIMTQKGESENYVDQAGTGDNPYGILCRPSRPADTYDLDDAIVDATEVLILKLPLPPGVEVAVFYEHKAGPVAVEDGYPAALGSAASGMVCLWAYTDAAAATDTLVEKVGTFAQVHAGHATEERIVCIKA